MTARERVEHGGGNGERGHLGSAWRREQRARDGIRAAAAHHPVPPLWHSVTGPMVAYKRHVEGTHCTWLAMTHADLNQLT